MGLGVLQVVLDKGEREDWFASNFIVAFAVIAGVCLVAAVFWEWWGRDPVVDIHLLKDRNFLVANILMFMLGFVLYASTMLVPIFLQTLLGYTALHERPGAVAGGHPHPDSAAGVGDAAAPGRPALAGGLGLLSVGLAMIFLMAPLNLQVDFRTVTKARALQTAGLAFLFVPINAAAFSFIAKAKMSNATGIINLARNIGGSAGIAFVTTMLQRRSQFHQSVLVAHLTPYDPGVPALVQGAGVPVHAAPARPGRRPGPGPGVLVVQQQAGMLSFVDNFWLLGVIFLALVPLALLLKQAGAGQTGGGGRVRTVWHDQNTHGDG